MYIQHKTGIKFNKKAKELTPHIVKKTSKEFLSPCTFLNQETNSCSIYEYRPLSCRMFMTFDDPELCESLGIEHKIFNSSGIPIFTKVLADIVMQIRGKGGITFSVAEIRNLFKKV